MPLAKSSLTPAWPRPGRSTKSLLIGKSGTWEGSALLFIVLLAALLTLHFPLLRLPFYWDEAGYYVPAARDLLLTGSVIPHSTVSNAHPPLVPAYLAIAWKVLGFSPLVTRIAMVGIAAFALLGVFRLARCVANQEVAIASVICTAVYPVFFAQSSLAHLDLAAAAFTIWGLLAYVERRSWATAGWFSLAVLAKETAILAPLALLAVWLFGSKRFQLAASSHSLIGALAMTVAPLTMWYAYHWYKTGVVFGNPEFFRYNVQATLNPLRFLLALGLRLWQVLGYMNLYLLTLATLFAMWLPPLIDDGEERQRISLPVQLSFVAVSAAYVMTMALVGGAVLARYMLPVVPLVIMVCISTLRRRVRYWRAVVAIVVLAFVIGWFVNPPYGFAMEDNLAYRDYIELHQRAERFIEQRYRGPVLTAWPASDELTRPYLGYVARPFSVVRIEDFTAEQVMAAAEERHRFNVALVFSTKYEPRQSWFSGWRKWQQWKTEFFGFHIDVPPAVAAQVLGGQLVYSDYRAGQWVGVIEMDQIQEASTSF